jgi:hypothetical protein
MNSIKLTSSQLKEINKMRKRANDDNKANYELWKMNYDEIKNMIEKQSSKMKNITLVKGYLLLTKSLVILHAGLYNNDKPLFEKGLNKLKKTGLEFLDEIANSENPCINFSFIDLNINGDKIIHSEEKYRNEEAYRQYAMFLKKEIEKFNDMKDYWFLTFS